jgi:hypothetical protein
VVSIVGIVSVIIGCKKDSQVKEDYLIYAQLHNGFLDNVINKCDESFGYKISDELFDYMSNIHIAYINKLPLSLADEDKGVWLMS